MLEDVKNRLYVLTHKDGAWQREPLQGAPAFGTVSASAIDDEESDDTNRPMQADLDTPVGAKSE